MKTNIEVNSDDQDKYKLTKNLSLNNIHSDLEFIRLEYSQIHKLKASLNIITSRKNLIKLKEFLIEKDKYDHKKTYMKNNFDTGLATFEAQKKMIKNHIQKQVRTIDTIEKNYRRDLKSINKGRRQSQEAERVKLQQDKTEL